jgi:hypothetical protein
MGPEGRGHDIEPAIVEEETQGISSHAAADRSQPRRNPMAYASAASYRHGSRNDPDTLGWYYVQDRMWSRSGDCWLPADHAV